MKPDRQKPLKFGDLVVSVYETYGQRAAKDVLRLAVNSRVVVFLTGQRFLIGGR